MPKHRNPLADIPPLTDFESIQRARPLIVRRFGDVLGVWSACGNAACARARRCQGPNASCVIAFMQALPDDFRRMLRYSIENRIRGLDVDEAVARAEARVEAEIGGFGE